MNWLSLLVTTDSGSTGWTPPNIFKNVNILCLLLDILCWMDNSQLLMVWLMANVQIDRNIFEFDNSIPDIPYVSVALLLSTSLLLIAFPIRYPLQYYFCKWQPMLVNITTYWKYDSLFFKHDPESCWLKPQFQLSTYPQSVIINIFLFPMDPAILPSGRYSHHLLVIVPPILYQVR